MAWLMLGLLAFLQVVVSMGHFSYAPMVSFIQQDLGLSAFEVGALPTAMFSGSVLLNAPVGWLVDRFGVKRSIVVGSVLFGSSLCLLYWVQTYVALLGVMFLVGTTYGFVTPLTAKGLVAWFDRERRGLAFGFKQSGVTLGIAAAAFVLPTVALRSGWGSGFLVSGLVVYVGGLIGWLAWREPPEVRVSSGVMPIQQMDPVSVITDRRLLAIYAGGWIYTAYQTAVTTFLVPYLHHVLGLNILLAAGLLGTSQIGGSVLRPIAGWISDRFFKGRRKEAMLLFCFVGGLGGVLLTLLPKGTAYPVIWTVLIVSGSAAFAWAGLYFTLISEIAGPTRTGAAAGVGSTFNALGGATGPLLCGILVDAFQYRAALAVLALIMLGFSVILAAIRLETPLVAGRSAASSGQG
jgi:MFS family permease